jgi:hypothetical protein
MCRVDKPSFCNDFAAEYSSSGLSINRRTCKNTLCNECGAPAGRANRVVVTDCGSWYAAAFAVRGRPPTGGLKLVPLVRRIARGSAIEDHPAQQAG